MIGIAFIVVVGVALVMWYYYLRYGSKGMSPS